MTPKLAFDHRVYNGQRSWDGLPEAELRRTWPQGVSAAKIAQAVNALCGTSFTRASVLGKVHRLGIATDGREAPAKLPANVDRPLKPAPIVKPKLISQPQAPYMALSSHGRMEPRVSGPDGNDMVIAPIADRMPVTLLDLANGHCKMVVSETVTGVALFCGCPCGRGRKGRFDPYCAHHTAAIKPKASAPIDLRGTGIEAIKPRALSHNQIGRRFSGL